MGSDRNLEKFGGVLDKDHSGVSVTGVGCELVIENWVHGVIGRDEAEIGFGSGFVLDLSVLNHGRERERVCLGGS